mmetsp:Transcript_29866/g.67556  ORF Transcript_29866/g.67556 Transcript_29866/m.67556 type:complete len:302 (-) Transcript_29866:261-1166(-)
MERRVWRARSCWAAGGVCRQDVSVPGGTALGDPRARRSDDSLLRAEAVGKKVQVRRFSSQWSAKLEPRAGGAGRSELQRAIRGSDAILSLRSPMACSRMRRPDDQRLRRLLAPSSPPVGFPALRLLLDVRMARAVCVHADLLSSRLSRKPRRDPGAVDARRTLVSSPPPPRALSCPLPPRARLGPPLPPMAVAYPLSLESAPLVAEASGSCSQPQGASLPQLRLLRSADALRLQLSLAAPCLADHAAGQPAGQLRMGHDLSRLPGAGDRHPSFRCRHRRHATGLHSTPHLLSLSPLPGRRA